MKINILVRLRNKTFLIIFVPATLSLLYQFLAMVGFVPKIEEKSLLSILMQLIELLALLGIIVDPTTKGISDSEMAITYKNPQ